MLYLIYLMIVEIGGKFGLVLVQSVHAVQNLQGVNQMLFFKLHLGSSKHTFQCAHLLTTHILLYVWYLLIGYEKLSVSEEGVGQYVHASCPDSIKHSILNLLLSLRWVFYFIKTFV